MENSPVKVSCAGRTLLTAADFPNGGYEIVQVEPSTTKPSLAGFGRFLGLNITRSELIYARAIGRMDLGQQMFLKTSGAPIAEQMRQNLRPTTWDINEAIQRTQTLLAAPDWDKAVAEMQERVFKQTTAYQLLDLGRRLSELERRGPGF